MEILFGIKPAGKLVGIKIKDLLDNRYRFVNTTS